MSNLLRAVVFLGAVILLSFSWTWATMVGPLDMYLDGKAPPGQIPYLVMRWMGLFGFFLMWMQLMVGILLPAKLAPTPEKRAELIRFHTWAGLLTVLVIALHPILFMSGIMERTQHIRWDMLYPVFSNGIYQVNISIGIMAFYLVLLGALAAILRPLKPLRKVWMKVHWLNGLAFLMVAYHCLKIGSETRFLGVVLPLTAAVVALTAALIRRRRTA